MKVAIIGCGCIGGTMRRWLKNNNPFVEVAVVDVSLGKNDCTEDADAAFVCIPVPTDSNGRQNVSELISVVAGLPDIPIFVRSTILPGTTSRLRDVTGRNVFFMPEFLTERTADADFARQPMVFTGEIDLLKQIFIGKDYIEMSPLEAEFAKYAHNVFAALKVTYFNCIEKVCTWHRASYENVRRGALLSGYINEQHTIVPGPDGQYGYGGKCLPKDMSAFLKFVDGALIGELISVVPSINDKIRSE